MRWSEITVYPLIVPWSRFAMVGCVLITVDSILSFNITLLPVSAYDRRSFNSEASFKIQANEQRQTTKTAYAYKTK